MDDVDLEEYKRLFVPIKKGIEFLETSDPDNQNINLFVLVK